MSHKGGTTTSEVKLPKSLERAAEDQLALAKRVGSLPFQPWTGPAVAAFTPQQTAAFNNASGAASSFGLGGGSTIGAGAGMPKPQTFAGGIRGYSAMPLYNEAVGNLPKSFTDALNNLLGLGKKPQSQQPVATPAQSQPRGELFYNQGTGRFEYPQQLSPRAK